VTTLDRNRRTADPRRRRPRGQWHAVQVFCSCGAAWRGWHAIGNPIIRDHYFAGHRLSDRPIVFAVADREPADEAR
jgi:hypothetical protein